MKVLENAQTGRMQQDQLCCSSKTKDQKPEYTFVQADSRCLFK